MVTAGAADAAIVPADAPRPFPVDLQARARLLRDWIAGHAPAEGLAWLDAILADVAKGEERHVLTRAMALAPRRLGKADLRLEAEHLRRAAEVRPGFDPTGLTVDAAARIALLLAANREAGSLASCLDSILRTADLRELVAVYRGFALFPADESLTRRAAEGVRSGMKPVFEAIAHRNPYPRENFDDQAWNQMVVKALFIGSELHPIQGLDERANSDLSVMLVDYAHERWAADRPVSIELWRALGRFADQRGFDALARVLHSGEARDRGAAALALHAAGSAAAREILDQEPDLQRQVADGRITWTTLTPSA